MSKVLFYKVKKRCLQLIIRSFEASFTILKKVFTVNFQELSITVDHGGNATVAPPSERNVLMQNYASNRFGS